MLVAAAPLAAQAPLPPDNGENGNDTDRPAPADPDVPTREEMRQQLLQQRIGLEQFIRDEVDDAVRRRFEDFSPLRSRRELFLEFSGGLTAKYRQAQHSPRSGQPPGGARAPVGISLTSAWFTVTAGYSDVVESELTLRYNGDYTLLDQEIIEVPRAVVIYNRPISQFVPFGVIADSFLFGVDGHFWRQSRGSETMALGQRAFHRDEVAQARYTLRVMNNLYMIGAFSSGNLLGKGQVDDSNNYPILADDKTRYIRGLGDSSEISRFLQIEFGGGFIFDFNALSFLRSDAHFSPEQATAQNSNYLNILVWGSVNRLSRNETALIEGLQSNPFRGGTHDDPGGHIRRSKWRMGANIDFAIRLAGNDLFVHSHYVHAEDGRLVRDAWGVDIRYTFDLPRIPFFLRLTPMFRYSELITNNNRNPLDETDPFAHPLRVSSGGVPGYTLADGAGFAANRREFMVGLNLTLARNVILGFEVVFNDDDFKQTRRISNNVRNTLYMLRLSAEF
jgi:hypothetical protein